MQAGSAGPVRLLALALTLLCDGTWAGCCWMLQEQTLGGGALGLYGSFIFACPIDHYSPNMAVALHLWKNNPDDHDPVLECSVTRSDGTVEPPFFGGTGDDAHNPLPSPLVAGRYDSSGVGELVGTGVEPGDVAPRQKNARAPAPGIKSFQRCQTVYQSIIMSLLPRLTARSQEDGRDD